jgi:hypothetical protein
MKRIADALVRAERSMAGGNDQSAGAGAKG